MSGDVATPHVTPGGLDVREPGIDASTATLPFDRRQASLPCAPASLHVETFTDAASYAAGAPVALTFTLRYTGTVPCLLKSPGCSPTVAVEELTPVRQRVWASPEGTSGGCGNLVPHQYLTRGAPSLVVHWTYQAMACGEALGSQDCPTAKPQPGSYRVVTTFIQGSEPAMTKLSAAAGFQVTSGPSPTSS